MANGSERVLSRHNASPAREPVKQEVLFVEDIIDPEILGGFVVNLHVGNNVVIERAVDVGDDVSVVERTPQSASALVLLEAR